VKTWRDLVSKQVLRCPECSGYGVVIQFRADHITTKCGCGYSKTEARPKEVRTPRNIPIPGVERFK